MANLLKKDKNLIGDSDAIVVAIKPQKRPLIVFAAIMSILGVVLLLTTRAAAPENLSLEPELASTITGCAKPVPDSTASGGQAIKFGCDEPSTGFVHPGVSVTSSSLIFIKGRIQANEEPWKTAYEQLRTSTAGSLNYTPKATATELTCQAGEDDVACSNLRTDSGAVYSQALMWYFTGNQAYADKAKLIMKNWSTKLTKANFSSSTLDASGYPDNAYWQNRLELGWSAETMVRGAEIIKHTGANWSQTDITSFEGLLRNVYLPHLSNLWTAGSNDSMTWSDALLSVGVFLDDQAIYDLGIQSWKDTVSSGVYVTRDGTQPPYYPRITSPRVTGLNTNYANGVTIRNTPPAGGTYKTQSGLAGTYGLPSPYVYTNGQEKETCRDLSHTFMGLGAMAAGAEVARNQGDDLYGSPEHKDRLLAGFEANANYVNQMFAVLDSQGLAINPTSFYTFDVKTIKDAAGNKTYIVGSNNAWKPTNFPNCAPPSSTGNTGYTNSGAALLVGSEIALNHYANRLGISMPQTKKLAERTRPIGRHSGYTHLMWETLTNAQNPN